MRAGVWPCVRAGPSVWLCAMRMYAHARGSTGLMLRAPGHRALTLLPSALWPSFPDGGSMETVKAFRSSQSRILDSLIRESSFLLAMLSTRFRLEEACRSQMAGLLAAAGRPPTRSWAALQGPAGAGGSSPHLDRAHISPSHLVWTARHSYMKSPGQRACDLPWTVDNDQQALTPGPPDP